MTTRTGNFPIAFRRGWGDWTRNLSSLAKWAAENKFEALDIINVTPADLDTLKSAGVRIGSADLIDFGNLLTNDAAKRAKLGEPDKYRVRYIEKMSSPFSQFMSGFAGSRIGGAWLKDSDFARALLARSLPEMEAQLRFVDEAVNDRNGAPVKSLAYCFCGF